MKFSIIIPITDSPILNQILESIKAQRADLAQGEIIVVGTDKSGIAQGDPHIRFIPTGESDRCASDKRNIGMRAAQGEIFLFLDDDCVPHPDWLGKHLTRHAAGEQVVGGAVEFGQENYYQLADNLSAFHDLLTYTLPGYRAYLATANLSVQRAVVETTDGMLPGKNRAEDLEWTVRMRAYGYQLFFDPSAIVFHNPKRRTFRSVIDHWLVDAPDTLRVRLGYRYLLNTPALAGLRGMYLLGAPFVAAWATIRTFSHPRSVAAYWRTLPLVYLTKLVWCWSAYRNFPKKKPGKTAEPSSQVDLDTL